jgi:hypothetical protein
MNRSLKTLRVGFLCMFLFIVVGVTQEKAGAKGLCSVEWCDCTTCHCNGFTACCEDSCAQCFAELNDCGV